MGRRPPWFISARMRPSFCQRGSRRGGRRRRGALCRERRAWPAGARRGRSGRPVPSAARVVDGPRSRAAGAARPAAQLVRRSAGDIASAACAGGFEATVPRRAGRGWPLLSVSVAQHVASRRRPASLRALAHELEGRQAPHRDAGLPGAQPRRLWRRVGLSVCPSLVSLAPLTSHHGCGTF